MSDRRRSNPEERERISSMTRDEVIEYCGKLGSDGPWCHRKSLAGKLMDHDAAQRATIDGLQTKIKKLESCQCEGCDNSLEGEAYCQCCWMKQRSIIEQQAKEIERLKGELSHWTFERYKQLEDELVANQLLTESKNQVLREALDWNGLKVSNNELEQALKYLGPTGNRAEAQIKASVEHLIYMRSKAQAALQEES